MALNDNLRAMLVKTQAGCLANGGFTFLNPKNPMVAQLLAQGFLEADLNTPDKADAAKVAMRLSATGLAEIGRKAAQPQAQAQAQPQPADLVPQTETVAKVAPTIHYTGTLMVMPEAIKKTGKAHRQETYPFSKLGVPQTPPATAENPHPRPLYDSFFVPATPDFNPGKALAGTVSSATKRYKDQTPPRKFMLVPVETDHEHGTPGARVLRTI
jgi:hypothetical protein